jgi:hypothetical protein
VVNIIQPKQKQQKEDLDSQIFDNIPILIDKDLSKAKFKFKERDIESAIDSYVKAFNRTLKGSISKELWESLV